MILSNRRITIGEVADDVGISFGSRKAIFTDILGMKRATANIVKKIATFWAKTTSQGHRLGDVEDVQRRFMFAQKGNNWWRIIGVWLWHWKQSLWKRSEEPRPKKAHQVRSNVKVLLTVFFIAMATGGVGDTKELVSEMFRRLEKRFQSVLLYTSKVSKHLCNGSFS